MISELQSQLQFVRAIQEVDTDGVEPLVALRDETEEGEKEGGDEGGIGQGRGCGNEGEDREEEERRGGGGGWERGGWRFGSAGTGTEEIGAVRCG